MTKERAVEILKYELDCARSDELYEALTIAIKSLIGKYEIQYEWYPCQLIDSYIINHTLLHDRNRRILVTYKTRSKRRMVGQVYSTGGKIMSTKINGKIIAWTFLPEPYKGEEP